MSLVPADFLERAAQRFALLSNPTRLRLINTLHARGEMSVTELARAAKVTKPNTSQHLNKLFAAGLLSRRRDGTTIYYWIDDQTIEELCRIVTADLRKGSPIATARKRRSR